MRERPLIWLACVSILLKLLLFQMIGFELITNNLAQSSSLVYWVWVGVVCVVYSRANLVPLTRLTLTQAPAAMASASSTSAKNLFVDSKTRLAERVQVNVNNMGSICRQVNRGSQSADMLTHSARNMALQVRSQW